MKDEFAVKTALSAAEALGILQESMYDGIISDYQMPEMDGIELLKNIRSHYPDIPFILFTGRGREEVVIQAFDAGADYYVQKGGEVRSQFRELSHKIRLAVEKRTVEMALRASEEHYRNVVEDQTEFICRFRPDGTHAFVNDAYCRYFGMPREQIMGHRFVPKIPDDDAATVRSYFASLTREHPGNTIEHRLILPDGSVRWHQWSDRAIFDESGTLVEYQSVGRDITDRKTAELDLLRKNEEISAAYQQLAAIEEELRTSFDDLAASQRNLETRELSLNAILEESPISQFVIDRNHKILYWNHALAVYSGIKADEVVGTDQQWRAFYSEKRPCLADLVVENTLDRIPEWYRGKYEKSVLIEDAYEATDFFRKKGKEGCWLHFTAGLIRDRNGDIIGAVESLEDVTGRKNAERELIQKNEELHAAYEQLTATEEELRQNYDELAKSQHQLAEGEEKYRNVFNAKNDPLLLVDTGTGAVIDLNSAACDLYGFPREEMLKMSLTDLSAEQKKTEDILARQAPLVRMRYHRKKDGTVFSADISSAFFELKGRSVLVLSVRDLSSVQRIADAVRLANIKLNLMIGITRHDVLNKLTPLIGYNGLLKEKIADSDTLQMLEKQEKALSGIRSQIEFTRAYDDLGVKSPLWQNVCQTASRAYAQFMDTISFSCDTASLEIYADPLLEKVFYNLFDNAFRHGEGISRIRISCRTEGTTLCIFFEDDGTGIPAEDKERIFSRGFGKNTGLGLFITREILGLTLIEIHETGEYRKGARFEFRVPESSFRFLK